MNKKKVFKNKTPTYAPGINDSEELDINATSQEINNGDSTEVTALSYDEVNPS